MSSQNLNTLLVALPALTAPVTRSQNATFASDCFQLCNLDNQQLWAVSIVAKIRTLNHKGTWGTSYITNHRQLRIDAEAFMGGFEITMFDYQDNYFFVAMQAVMDWNSANSSDATTPNTIDGLLKEAGELSATPQSILRQIYQFLRYLIG